MQIRRVEYRLDRGNDRNVITKQSEVLDAFFLRPQHGQSGAGHGCFKAQGKEDDLPVGVLLGNPQRVKRRVHHAHIGPISFCLQQAFFRAGHSHRIAERGENHAGHVGQSHAVVNASHRQNTNRAAGAMDQLDPVRQHCLDTVSEDGVRVASADFHDVYRFSPPLLNLRHERVDFLQQKLRFFGISEFVDVFHFVFFLYLKLSGHPIMANEPRLSASSVCTKSQRM